MNETKDMEDAVRDLAEKLKECKNEYACVATVNERLVARSVRLHVDSGRLDVGTVVRDFETGEKLGEISGIVLEAEGASFVTLHAYGRRDFPGVGGRIYASKGE